MIPFAGQWPAARAADWFPTSRRAPFVALHRLKWERRSHVPFQPGQATDAHARERAPGPSEPDSSQPSTASRARHADRGPLPGRASRSPSSRSAASGARRRRSGSSPASGRPRSATRAASRQIPPTRSRARARPVTPKPCASYSILRRRATTAPQGVLGEPRPDPGHAPGQRRRHRVPLGDLCPRRGAARGRRGLEADVPGAAVRGRLRRDHDGDRRPAGAALLLRRGLPPAVSRQEPERLLPEPRHGRDATRRASRSRRSNTWTDGAQAHGQRRHRRRRP